MSTCRKTPNPQKWSHAGQKPRCVEVGRRRPGRLTANPETTLAVRYRLVGLGTFLAFVTNLHQGASYKYGQ
jgi:hypothetical protein